MSGVELAERAARAVYAQMPNISVDWVANTVGGYSQRRIAVAWEDAKDRHDDCRRIADAVISEIEAAYQRGDTWHVSKHPQ